MRLHELTSPIDKHMDNNYKTTAVGGGKTGYTGRTQNSKAQSRAKVTSRIRDIDLTPRDSSLTNKSALQTYGDKIIRNFNTWKDSDEVKKFKNNYKKISGRKSVANVLGGEVFTDITGKNKSLKYTNNVLGGDLEIEFKPGGNASASWNMPF